MDNQSGCDFLSDLPLSIIHIILALVPIKDAVRTSILSREWRYTWATLPQIVLNAEGICVDFIRIHKIDQEFLKNIINHVLLHHKGPIHKFKLHFRMTKGWPDIDQWVLHLSRKDNKELIVIMDGKPSDWLDHELPSIYFCEKLTYLALYNCKLLPPPSTFKGFLFLRCAVLSDLYLSSDEVERFVAHCPLLEKLYYDRGRMPGSTEIRFSAPNLKYFDLRGDYTEIRMSAPLLAETVVRLTNKDLTATHVQKGSSACNYTNFMGDITNLKKLIGDISFIEYLSIGIESRRHSLVFHHLEVIELYRVNFYKKKELSVVARLIMDAPNLRKLEISEHSEVNGEDDESEDLDVSFKDLGFVSGYTFEKLRVLNISSVRGFPLATELLKFLLESSPVLETMNVYSRPLPCEEMAKFEAKLQGLAWASPNAKLCVKFGYFLSFGTQRRPKWFVDDYVF